MIPTGANEGDTRQGSAPQLKGAFVIKLCSWLLAAVGRCCQLLLLAWGTLALYWSNVPWPWLRSVMALAFALLVVAAFWIWRTRRLQNTVLVAFFLLLAWWAMIKPSHDRDWRPEVAVMPRALIEGDRVRITGVRNFDYRSPTDFTVRHEEREVLLSHLRGVDFFVSYWAPGPMAHTFLSFVFDNAPPVCVSIEARLERGEKFAPLASCFKEAELIYVVGDERDIARLRSNYRKERVYLYRTRAKPEGARRLFLAYLHSINQLADQPEFYHLLRNNCTVNIFRHVSEEGGKVPLDIRLLLNGYSDAFVYENGMLASSLPFAELRERSLINAAALQADQSPDFSQLIRQNLPTSQ